MTVRERDGGPVVVSMPAEIDLANAGRVGEQLCTAASPGVTIIVADLTGTQFPATGSSVGPVPGTGVRKKCRFGEDQDAQ